MSTGHTSLHDGDSLETVELLQENEEELIQSLIRKDTILLRKLNKELERQLAEIEEGIKIFSEPKVLKKNDT
ncbi:hypothetical protein X975_10091, partial [Stegodyphus mimosarum]